ncbi:MAG: hypothetical protein ACREM3_01090 [Candidatus Rokuibacteriota bacterium]
MTASIPARRSEHPRTLEDRVLLFCAALFFLIAVGWLMAPLVGLLLRRELTLIYWYIPGAAAVAALIGFGLIRNVRVGRKVVIPRQDREVLGAALQRSEDPVAEYIRLSGLIGVTGVFQKLGVSGMPLATILMTIVLCLLALTAGILRAQGFEIAQTLLDGFMDLAKLTLGAFIGSFVTKRREDAGAEPRGAAAPRPR